MNAPNYQIPKNQTDSPLSQKPEDRQKSDKELWDSFRSGKNAAFITIYNSYFKLLFSYGIRINDNEELVKDVIQDLFLYLKNNCRSLGETDSIKFYLFKCLKRRIFKELKSWDNSKQTLDESQCFEITFSQEEVMINQQMDFEKVQLINRAIAKLSPRKREAIYYIFYEGLNYQQVSDLLDLKDSKSARDLTYKALRSLRESLGFIPIFLLTNLP